MSSESEFDVFLDGGSTLPDKWKAVQFERPVVLLGWDSTGKEVTAHASTTVVGAHGCILRANASLPFDGRVFLCCNHKEAEGQVQVSEPLERNLASDLIGRVQYIVLFDRADARFWEVRLEPANAQERVQVECCACHFCIAAELNEADEMVFVADSVVVLRCPICKVDTRFTAAQSRLELLDVAQDPNLVVSGHHVYHMQPTKKEVNERQFRRITTKTKAFLRIPGKDGDLVDVLDLSRGGIRFQSTQNYEQGLELEVAVHYVDGGNNIFQKAKIVRKHRRPSVSLPGEYGVMFVGTSKAG